MANPIHVIARIKMALEDLRQQGRSGPYRAIEASAVVVDGTGSVVLQVDDSGVVARATAVLMNDADTAAGLLTEMIQDYKRDVAAEVAKQLGRAPDSPRLAVVIANPEAGTQRTLLVELVDEQVRRLRLAPEEAVKAINIVATNAEWWRRP